MCESQSPERGRSTAGAQRRQSGGGLIWSWMEAKIDPHPARFASRPRIKSGAGSSPFRGRMTGLLPDEHDGLLVGCGIFWKCEV
jgi:hypothetical protein